MWCGNGSYPGDRAGARIGETRLAPVPHAVALPRRSARLGAAGPARHRRPGGGRLRLGDGRGQRRAVLRRGGPQHVGELARLHLRSVRSGRDRHRRQAAGRAVDAGAVAAGVRLSHLGAGSAAGDRGRAHDPGAVPGGAAAGRAGGRADGRRGAGGHADHGAAEPGQRVRLAADPAAGAGGRRHLGGAADRVAAAAADGRRLGRPGLPGEDDPGLAGAARAGGRLPAGRARGAAAHPLRPRRAGRAGHGRDLAVVDDGGLAGPGGRPAVRGRQRQRLGVRAGLRLQRAGTADRGLGDDRRAAVADYRRGGRERAVAERPDEGHHPELAPAAVGPVRGRRAAGCCRPPSSARWAC